MSKRWISRALSLALVVAMALATFAVAGGNEAVRLQDDLYEAVNAEWLAATEIPAHKVMVGGFMDLQDEVIELLMADFAAMPEETAAQFEALSEFQRLYAMTADYDTRNAQGAEPLAPYLAEIDALDTLAALNAALPGLILRGMPSPVYAGMDVDMGNAQYYALYAVAPSLILPDVSLYGTPTGDFVLDIYGQILGALLLQCGYSEEDAVQIVAQALAFDALLVPYMPSAEESSDYTKLYNPTPLADFVSYSTALDLAGLVEALVSSAPDYVVLTNPAYFAALDQVVTEESFPLLKGWMTAQMAFTAAPMLSQDIAATAAAYGMMLTGQAEPEDPQRLAIGLAYQVFSGPVGLYYGHTYFGEEAKQDVTEMVEQLIQVFGHRLQQNDWLSADTAKMAQRKLDTMAMQIGYPDKLQPEYSLLKVVPTDEGGTVLGNIMEFTRIAMEANFARCGEKVDHSYWNASAADVNAFYNPMANAIIFPAAILQAPFYSPDQSRSQNLGGIGAVVGHEITHAFDSNGAKFDEYGSLSDWWTEEDYAAFGERIESMVAMFDGIPHAGGTVNGRQVVSENIADAGGLSCALEVCLSLPDADTAAFFENWATIWRMKATPELEELLLTVGVHSPNRLRANMPVRNFDAFYEAFDVVQSDDMYLAPEERITIW